MTEIIIGFIIVISAIVGLHFLTDYLEEKWSVDLMTPTIIQAISVLFIYFNFFSQGELINFLLIGFSVFAIMLCWLNSFFRYGFPIGLLTNILSLIFSLLSVFIILLFIGNLLNSGKSRKK